MNDPRFRLETLRRQRRPSLPAQDFDPKGPGRSRASHQARAKKFLKKSVEALSELQDKLYAQDEWGVLLIFQAMDAAGKDGTIKHVMSGVNPQGCQVYGLQGPVAEELDHDFLWRVHAALPERGRIGIFNRSYYEEVLVVRVHPEFLGAAEASPKSSRGGSGRSASRTSTPSSGTWRATAP